MAKKTELNSEKLKPLGRVFLLLSVAGLLTILLIRLWKVPEFFSFNFDEEYQATLAWSIVKDFHVIWIGVSTSGLKYYLGPGFTYLNAALFYLTRGDPVILAYFSALWGLVTTTSVFYISKKIFDTKTSVISAVIYGASSLFVFYDRRFWNPLPIPFVAIWLTYSLIMAKEDSRWYILTAVLIASAFHIHLSLMVFWPIILFSVLSNIRKIKIKTWILMIGSYLIITLPLIVFDFVHNFDNFLAPFKFLTGRGESDHTPIQGLILPHLTHLWYILGRIWFLRFHTNIQEEHNLGIHGNVTQPHPLLSLFSILILLYFFLKIKVDKKITVLRIVFLLYLGGFIFYPGIAGEYFLLAFLTLFTLAAGLFLSRLPNPISIAVISIFIAVNAITVLSSNQGIYGLATRKILIQKVMKNLGNNSFSLETFGPDKRKYHPYGGWRFLFKVYGRAPDQSFADEFFGWIYHDEISIEKPRIKVIVTENLEYHTPNISKVYREGPYRAYIIRDN